MEASAKLKDLRNHVLRLDPENPQGMKRRILALQRRISEERQGEFTASLPYPEVIEYECDCGWIGKEGDLINPFAIGRDRHIEGESCPKCEANVFEKVK